MDLPIPKTTTSSLDLCAPENRKLLTRLFWRVFIALENTHIKRDISLSENKQWRACFCLEVIFFRRKRRICCCYTGPVVLFFKLLGPCSNGSVLVTTTNMAFPFQLDDDPILPWTKGLVNLDFLTFPLYIHPIPSISMKIWLQSWES